MLQGRTIRSPYLVQIYIYIPMGLQRSSPLEPGPKIRWIGLYDYTVYWNPFPTGTVSPFLMGRTFFSSYWSIFFACFRTFKALTPCMGKPFKTGIFHTSRAETFLRVSGIFFRPNEDGKRLKWQQSIIYNLLPGYLNPYMTFFRDSWL